MIDYKAQEPIEPIEPPRCEGEHFFEDIYAPYQRIEASTLPSPRDVASDVCEMLSEWSRMVISYIPLSSFLFVATCRDCARCGSFADMTTFALEETAAQLIAETHKQTLLLMFGSCIAKCCDPRERMVDGLTVRECLDRFRQSQQERVLIWSGDGPWLTSAQKDAARLAWSAELKRKQQEAREKERVEVVCDDDRWEQ